MLNFFGLFDRGGKEKDDAPTSEPWPAIGGDIIGGFFGDANKFFQKTGDEAKKIGDGVVGFFGMNKKDPAVAEGVGAGEVAAPRTAATSDIRDTNEKVSADFVMVQSGSGISTDLSNKPDIGLGSLFLHTNEAINKLADDGSKGFRRIGKVFQGENKDDSQSGPLVRVSDGAAGVFRVGHASLQAVLSVPGGLVADAAGLGENLIHREKLGNQDQSDHHLVSTNTANVVKSASDIMGSPIKMMSELFDPDEDDKLEVFRDSGKELIESSTKLVSSIAGVGAGILGFDINEKIRKADAERRLKEEAEEKARREAEEEAEKAKRKTDEEERKRKDAAEAATKADDQKKTNKDTDFADKSLEFKSLFYIANDHDGYSRGFDESTRGDSILMRSKFKLNNESVNSVTFFENVNVESWKSGRFYGTQKRTTENGKKEVVFVGDEAFNAQDKMYKEYFENAKEILELKAKVEKYYQGKGDEKIKFGDLFDIKEQKDFNFLINKEGKIEVNSPLKQRIDKINKKINGITLPNLNEDESNKIEKDANEYAKILLVEQVKNNCLYTKTNGKYEEAKRINIFRGKKDFNTGKSVTEVKFGSSCQKGDFALIPVDQQSGLFCKVSYDENKEAKIEYFIKKDNELKLIKYDKNLKYADDSDVSNKDKIINVIENHIIEVSWSDKIVNSTKQLDTDMPSAGGDNKGSTTPDDDVDGIKSFGSQSFVIDRQAEYRLKSRNTADWWNNKTRIPCIESFKTKHSDTGFSIEKKSTRLSSTGNKFISTFSLHNDEDENTKQKILASEFEIDVKLDKDNKIIELNTEIDRNKNPNLNEAMKILDGLKIQDGKIQDPSSTHTTKGIDSRFFKKPTGFGMLPDSLSGEVKQGGSMVVNMNVFDNDGNKKSRIRVEFGVHNRGLGLRTTHDRLIIRNFGKTEDSVDKWAKKIKESPRIQCDGSAR